MRRAAVFLFFLLATHAALAGAGDARFVVRDVELVDVASFNLRSPVQSGHDLMLGAVILEGSGWTRAEVLDGVAGMAGLLTQCGIRLARMELTRVAVPHDYLDLFTPRSRELAADVMPRRPTLYFVRDTRQRPAFDAEAVGRGNSHSRPEMADSVWVTRAAPDLPVVLAHELAHVLANSGAHVDLPGNLMRDASDPAHTHLTEAQCARIIERGARHGLLVPSVAD
ncbi:MAG: hypothetical protein GWP66_04975 [Gammaproteobacteria bacterium]|jgi:hypothetical protein|nr:hypothetical protein [Gammaproteobacteria bacterium]